MEFVFVVPRTALFPDFYPQGLLPFGPSGSEAVKSGASLDLQAFEATVESEGFFVERAYAERTPTLKQVIPYSLIECDGLVLLFRRLSTGGEVRLHGKHSIGIGGHINPEDLDVVAEGPSAAKQSSAPQRTSGSVAARNPIDAGTHREIAEELAVSGEYKVRRVGLLNDDSNPVGAVHVGVVQVVRIRGSVEIRERDQLEGRLVPSEELNALLAQGANFETWSKLLIPRLDELLPKPLAAFS
jgi:predicted NUDIX family phosphoesterase